MYRLRAPLVKNLRRISKHRKTEKHSRRDESQPLKNLLPDGVSKSFAIKGSRFLQVAILRRQAFSDQRTRIRTSRAPLEIFLCKEQRTVISQNFAEPRAAVGSISWGKALIVV